MSDKTNPAGISEAELYNAVLDIAESIVHKFLQSAGPGSKGIEFKTFVEALKISSKDSCLNMLTRHFVEVDFSFLFLDVIARLIAQEQFYLSSNSNGVTVVSTSPF